MTTFDRIIVACADGYVGKQIVEWISNNHSNSISLVVTVSENEIFEYCRTHSIPVEALGKRSLRSTVASRLGSDIDIGLLLWWPKIISQDDISIAKEGFINTHPSLLPLHRGKNPNFWALKDDEPFGVSIHFLGTGIDDGDIIAQQIIPYTWIDDAEALYKKGLEGMIELFKSTFLNILRGTTNREHQDLSGGSFHYAKDMDPVCQIKLDKTYSAKELLNLIRARTFGNYPACWFSADDGEEYEVRVTITPRPSPR